MKLLYNKLSNKDLEIKSRMESMTLAFEKEEHTDTTPILVDGNKIITGITKITKHLDEVAGELHSWYYCNC